MQTNSTPNPSLPVIRRLPKYYRYLKQLQKEGVTSISSRELAEYLGTTASQVRQDFNCFGDVNGRQGIGYSIDNLVSMLEHLLFGDGEGHEISTIMVGAGRLGKAVSRFITNEPHGYNLVAAFDASPDEIGKTIGGVEVLPIEELEEFCKSNHPEVAVLCVSREPAVGICDRLVKLGVKGFWNFSHYDLSVPYKGEVVVENVHLGDSLMSLAYRLRNGGGD